MDDLDRLKARGADRELHQLLVEAIDDFSKAWPLAAAVAPDDPERKARGEPDPKAGLVRDFWSTEREAWAARLASMIRTILTWPEADGSDIRADDIDARPQIVADPDEPAVATVSDLGPLGSYRDAVAQFNVASAVAAEQARGAVVKLLGDDD
jgi:hypothetical protein